MIHSGEQTRCDLGRFFFSSAKFLENYQLRRHASIMSRSCFRRRKRGVSRNNRDGFDKMVDETVNQNKEVHCVINKLTNNVQKYLLKATLF